MSTTPHKPENSHTIPQFYQKLFLDSNKAKAQNPKIWVYSKSATPKPKKIKENTVVPGIYEFQVTQESVGMSVDVSTERDMGRLRESPTAVIFHAEILKEKKLTESSKTLMAKYLISQIRRTEYHRQVQLDLIRQTIRHLTEQFYKEKNPNLSSSELKLLAAAAVEQLGPDFAVAKQPELFSKLALGEGSNAETVIVTLPWTITKSPPGSEFIFSDDPICIDGSLANGGCLSFPLSRSYFLKIGNSSTSKSDYGQLTRQEVEDYNIATIKNAKKEVYGGRSDNRIKNLVDLHIASN